MYYILQHIEIDCGIEIWHNKSNPSALIVILLNKSFSKSLINLASGILVDFKNPWLCLGILKSTKIGF